MNMEKEYPADIICRFTTEGKIIPVKFRIKEGDAYLEFKILSYNEKFRHMEYRQGFMTEYQIVSEIEYCCRVRVDETEKTVRLKYYIGEMRWTVKV